MSKPKTLASIVASVAVASFLVTACGATAPTPTTAPATRPPATTPAAGGGGGGNVQQGKALFEQKCQACHPSGGTAQGVGPALKGASPDLVRERVTKGQGQMPAFADVTSAQLEDLVAYVQSLK